MNRRFIVAGVVLALLAIVPFVTYPLWKGLLIKQASIALYEKTKALVEKNAQLKPMWDEAISDGVLTVPEARAIWERAGEKMDPEQ